MQIGFLLGAGFSRGIEETMPLTARLLETLEAYGAIPDYVPESIRGDLEQLLSYLWTNYPWFSDIEYLQNKSNCIALTQKLYEILAEAEIESWKRLTKDYRDYGNNHPANLKNAVKNIGWQADFAGILAKNDRFVVVTMNYDTLLERLMIAKTSSSLVYQAPLQPLTRIWRQEEPLNIPLSPMDMSIYGLERYINPRLFKLHGSLSWYSFDLVDVNSIIYSASMNGDYADSVERLPHAVYDGTLSAVIIPPVSDKSSLYSNRVLRAQWMGAHNALKECEELYCVGYSFPKTDLALQLFLSRVSANLQRVYIVKPNFDNDLKQQLKSVFPHSVEFKHIGGPDCVRKMANDFIEQYGSILVEPKLARYD